MPDHRPPTTEPLRFGVFDIDPSTRELRKHGVRIKLQDQPFAVLLILLEKPGQLVTKEELQQRLWPADTFVEFDKGIYNALKRLRETLGDNAENPRYIETIPKRGYRFVCQVDQPLSQAAALSAPKARFEAPTARRIWLPRTAESAARFPSTKRLLLLFSILGLLLAGAILRLNFRARQPMPSVVDSVQLTNDRPRKSDFTVRLLSDGSRLYFQESSANGVALTQVSTQGGETVQIPLALESPVIDDISPSGSDLLVSAGVFQGGNPERPLWVVPLPGGSPHRVGDILAHDACWAPDGRHLVFVNNSDLFLAKSDGSEARKLVTAVGFPVGIRFSPDGTRLRFTLQGRRTHVAEWDIMEVGANGNGLHRLPIHGSGGTWSADGKYYFYQTDRDIWVLPEQRSVLGKAELGTPVQLTTGPLVYGAPLPNTDGMHLFVYGTQERIELLHYDLSSQRLTPFLRGISAGELEVSPDGQWVAYTTYPDSTLWRSRLDGTERLQLTFAPINAHEPRWSPDGKQILFTDVPSKICVVSADGGTPRRLMPDDRPNLIGAGAWLPDGNSIIFGRVMGCSTSDVSCYGNTASIYRLDLRSQQVSKLPGSDGMIATRVSRDGRYLTAITTNQNKVMLYDSRAEQWSELTQGVALIAWSHDGRFVYLVRKNETQQADLVRISVPAGKIERVLDLKDMILGGYWPGWVSLLPDDSPLLMLDRSTQEIYRLDLQYR